MRPLRLAGVALVVAALALAVAPSPQAQSRVTVVVTGLDTPWALAFAPGGRLFVTERPGRIRVIRNGALEPEPVATLAVAESGEGGLMGLALDPRFDENARLYVCHTAEKNGRLLNRVVRLTLSGGVARDPRVILDDMPGARIHNGCRVKFGPDGTLFVTMGDAAVPERAQRRDSLSGKILRLNADGSVPSGNPFPNSFVYSLGHRNPQGLGWDRAGRLFAVEHGPSAHDEVNLIVPGGNYGWPEVRGTVGDARYIDPIAESGDETWAPSGIAFLGADLYVAGLRGRRLLRLTLGADGTSVARVTTVLDGYGRLRDVVAGPDGALYVTTSNRDGRGWPSRDDDRVLRITP